MNKFKTFAVMLLMMGAMVAHATLNDTEKKIAGKYNVSTQTEFNKMGMVISLEMNGVTEFSDDNTGSFDGKVTAKFTVDNGNYQNTFNVNVKLKSPITWSVNDFVLKQKRTDIEASIESVTAEKQDQFSQMIIGQMSSQLESMIKQSTKQFEESADDIVKILPEKVIVRKAGDMSAPAVVYTRISTSM